MTLNIPHHNHKAEICVVGRCDFETGIGYQTYVYCELLSRSYPICILPTEPLSEGQELVTLPNGRKIPICCDINFIKVAFYMDVLWNGAHDFKYQMVPAHALRFVSIMCDSETIPDPWVDIINNNFEIAIAPTRYTAEILAPSGVNIPHVILPLALDIDAILARAPIIRGPCRFRFGSIASFHRRKDPEVILMAFLHAFYDRDDVELVLHSNLAFGENLCRLRQIVNSWNAKNVVISNESLTSAQRDELIDSFHVFVSCSRGEGYSIGPREALARGKVLAVSDIGAHRDLQGDPGVFFIPSYAKVPARYPELDNLVFGEQSVCDVGETALTLQKAYEFAKSNHGSITAGARRDATAQFSFSALAISYAALINTAEFAFRNDYKIPSIVSFPEAATQVVSKCLGPRVQNLSHLSRRVIKAHDGGFFSVFNTYMSHLVWDLWESRCRMTLPDWDVSRMSPAGGGSTFTSWCYSRAEDGNSWTSFFEPLFGLSANEMNDPDVLYENAAPPEFAHNEAREPLLTYIHAYRLYQTPQFKAWRQQYNQVFRRHVRILPAVAREVETKSCLLDAPLIIGAHVKHPSHVTEQPNGSIAYADHYIDQIRKEVVHRGYNLEGDDWKVFLGTDQDRVVRQFLSAFGDRIICFSDVSRTTDQDDTRFDQLSNVEQRMDGYQLQHLKAANPKTWSPRLAVEVIRDAILLSKCNLMLHVTSNVSTAVAYMNPEVEMLYCLPNAHQR